MRFCSLQLIKFGPFDGLQLDLSPHAGLHLILGANEAGKSTLLRAIHGFLFGIPETTRDDHQHAKRELKVGALLEDDQGQRVRLIRRKGRKNTLLDEAGGAVDEAVLARILGGVGREAYESLYGFGHDALVSGGRELAEGGGSLGESLFSAETGIQGVFALRAELQRRAEALFVPRGQNPPVNRALSTFKKARRESSDLGLKPREWAQRVATKERCQAEVERIKQELGEVWAERTRLERAKRVRPRLLHQAALTAKLEALGPVRPLPDGCTETRSAAQRHQALCAARRQSLTSQRDKLKQELATLTLPQEVLAAEESIEALRDQLSGYTEAQREIPLLEARLGDLRSARQRAADRLALPRSAPADDADRPLMIAAPEQARARALVREGERLHEEHRQLDRLASELSARRESLARTGAAAVPPQHVAALRRALARARGEGDLPAQLDDLQGREEALTRELTRRLQALPLCDATADQLAALPVPVIETVERFGGELARLERRGDSIESTHQGLDDRRARAAAAEAALLCGDPVPSREELQAARRARDVLWGEVRSRLVDGGGADPRAPGELARAYEADQTRADELADRLRREAERVAQREQLSAEQRLIEAAAAELDQKRRALDAERADWEARWRGAWAPAGVDPLCPDEMRRWLSDHATVLGLAAQREELQRTRRALRDRAERAVVPLREALAACEVAPSEEAPFSAALQQAEAALEEVEEARRRADRWEVELSQLDNDLCQTEARKTANADELEGWQRRWGAAMQEMGLPPSATVAMVEALLDGAAELERLDSQIASASARREVLAEQSAAFAATAAALARRCLHPLEDAPPHEQAAALVEALREARDRRNRRAVQLDQLAHLEEEVARVEDEERQDVATLEGLMAAAGCATVDELQELEARATRHRELTAELQAQEEQLLAEGLPLEELEEQARDVELDTLAETLVHLETAQAALERALDQAQRELGAVEDRLAQMDGRRAAADAADEAQGALAALRDHVEQYVRLRLAAAALDRAIEQHRARHQGPVLRRAGAMLAQITAGGFDALEIGYTAADKPVLRARRAAGGDAVPLDGLSDGSRDQLFLVLRLASIEQHLQSSAALPLALDDVLVNFDETRARAVLKLLGELATRTQILLFTHHLRTVELARSALPPERFVEHTLER